MAGSQINPFRKFNKPYVVLAVLVALTGRSSETAVVLCLKTRVEQFGFNESIMTC